MLENGRLRPCAILARLSCPRETGEAIQAANQLSPGSQQSCLKTEEKSQVVMNEQLAILTARRFGDRFYSRIAST
jgi:hypothetical protein